LAACDSRRSFGCVCPYGAGGKSYSRLSAHLFRGVWGSWKSAADRRGRGFVPLKSFVECKIWGFCLIANILMQIGLVVCTGLGFLFTSLKLPHYGVIANLIGQVFWLYSSYRAWREADQIGIFVSTICITLILIYGVTNYWLFGETFSVKN
jgi:hypothetical protein